MMKSRYKSGIVGFREFQKKKVEGKKFERKNKKIGGGGVPPPQN